MPDSTHAGDLLAGRYRLDDLLTESAGGRFWLAHDEVLHRAVAIHLIAANDERAEGLMAAARRTAPYHDRRLLRVLDADESDNRCYVVNEWGQGTSLDIMLESSGPLQPRRAAWVAAEIAESLAGAHEAGLEHGRMVPANVLIDLHGQVRILGFAVDAALHGLPPGRQSADLIDTAAVLYAAMTGKWAGISSCNLDPAPTENGQVLRPRRVRAGIPRQLDDLCDQVINSTGANGRSAFDLSTMSGIAEALSEFVGDASGMGGAESWSEHHAPSVTPAPWADPAPPGAEVTSAEPTPADRDATLVATAPAPETEMPTQAGIPVFDQNNDVGWIQTRSSSPHPPPPLEDAAAKPLFAPDPADGQPVRRPRPGATPAQTGDYWPWEVGTSTGLGAGSSPVPDHSGDEVVPGRRWFRLAMFVALSVILLVAALAVYQLTSPEDEPEPPRPVDTPQISEPTPFSGLTAVDFDPQGSAPREENPDLVPLALDGDPATSWQTSTYRQNLGRPVGLKDGVGLLLDLGSVRDVRQIDIDTLGGPTSLSVYVSETAPIGVAELTPAGTVDGTGTLSVALEEAVPGRFVIVWLTSLPPVEAEYRGSIAEVVIQG